MLHNLSFHSESSFLRAKRRKDKFSDSQRESGFLQRFLKLSNIADLPNAGRFIQRPGFPEPVLCTLLQAGSAFWHSAAASGIYSRDMHRHVFGRKFYNGGWSWQGEQWTPIIAVQLTKLGSCEEKEAGKGGHSSTLPRTQPPLSDGLKRSGKKEGKISPPLALHPQNLLSSEITQSPPPPQS